MSKLDELVKRASEDMNATLNNPRFVKAKLIPTNKETMTPHERALEAACKEYFKHGNVNDGMEKSIKTYLTILLDSPEIEELAKSIDFANAQGTVNAAKLMVTLIKKEVGIL